MRRPLASSRVTEPPFPEGASILVDTSVLVDVVTGDADWRHWSEPALRRAADKGPTLINQIVYAELSARFARQTELDNLLTDVGISREHLPWPAAFLAAHAHQRYRRRGGKKLATLPDFFIGAHAAVRRYPLLTRDPKRQRTYFPTVSLICPDPH